ncbi:hypothetical protein, partial [Acinetobacter faecalis]|uniref:hypothetical protein n=1 Tax=Acinetobacter faecalis TaxID=2665161 RepID=UPI002A9373F7|nr:hypothetical protein [Acinetobacter faecalis]
MTGSEKSDVEKAIVEAEEVLAKVGATAIEYTAASEKLDAIVAAAKALEEQETAEEQAAEALAEAKADLSAAIDEAKEVLKGLTGDEKAAVETAIVEAEKVLNDADSTVTELNAETAELNQVVAAADAAQKAKTPE